MAPNAHPDSPPRRSAVRFGPKDFAIFRMTKPQRRAEALQKRVLPRLDALLEEAFGEVRALYGVEPLEDSIISRWPNFRARRDRELEEHYDSAFAGLSGQRVPGKWHGAIRKDGSAAQVLPFRLGAMLDENGPSVLFYNHWLTGLDAASFLRPLEYLECFTPDLDRLFRESQVIFSARCENWHPSRSAARTMAAVRSSGDHAINLIHRPSAGSAVAQSASVRSALARLYPIYDSFIQLAKSKRPRLGAMLACLGERTGGATGEPPQDAMPKVARPNRQDAASRRGAPRPFIGERAASTLDDVPAVTYPMELRGARVGAFKIGCAHRLDDRARTFNQAAMPELGGISYVPILSEPWDNRDDAFDMEQEVLSRLRAWRHPANQEVVTGLTRGELEGVWAAAAEEIRRRR